MFSRTEKDSSIKKKVIYKINNTDDISSVDVSNFFLLILMYCVFFIDLMCATKRVIGKQKQITSYCLRPSQVEIVGTEKIS